MKKEKEKQQDWEKNMKREREIKEYIKKIVEEITTFVPLIQLYHIRYQDEEENNDGGEFAVGYEPTCFSAEFHVYRKIFDQIPDKGLTEGFKNYIKFALSHEVGHLYVYELEGAKRDIEKIASLIGLLIIRVLDSRKV